MLVSLSWKNVWRNKARSLVVICAVLLGLFGGVFAVGIMNGWIEQRMHDAIYNEISHVQIHNPKFMQNEELNLSIQDYGSVTAVLDTMSDIKAYAPCTKVFAMIQSDWSSYGGIIRGIEPEKEKNVSEIYQNIIEGEYFTSSGRIPPAVIGSKMAESLKLKNFQATDEKLKSIDKEKFPETIIEKVKEIGDRRYRTERDFIHALSEKLDEKEIEEFESALVDYFSFYRLGTKISLTLQSKSGELVTPTFRVKGIYKTSNSMFDGMNVFVEKDRLNEHIGLNNKEVHEISTMSKDNETGHILGEKLASVFPEKSVLSWKKVSPELAMYADFGNLFNYVYVVIILFALAFGIINTMMMSVLERIKELGMLMAIGMNKLKVFGMIMFESIFLTFTGAFAGMIISGSLIKLLYNTGINFSMWEEGFEAFGYASIVYPFVESKTFIGISILVIITGMLASIWPARKALKLNPSEAIRSDV